MFLSTEAWQSGPLLLVRRRWSRWRGIRAVPPGWGVLIATRSVHGIGLTGPLMLAGIDGSGKVIERRRLLPATVVVMPGVRWIAEFPGGSPVPPPGAEVAIRIASPDFEARP